MNSSTLVKKLEKQMTDLINCKNKVVIVYSVWNGEIEKEKGELEEVDTKRVILKIAAGRYHTPFLAESTAIQKITDENNKIIYENDLVDESYNKDTSSDIRKKCGFTLLKPLGREQN